MLIVQARDGLEHGDDRIEAPCRLTMSRALSRGERRPAWVGEDDGASTARAKQFQGRGHSVAAYGLEYLEFTLEVVRLGGRRRVTRRGPDEHGQPIAPSHGPHEQRRRVSRELLERFVVAKHGGGSRTNAAWPCRSSSRGSGRST